jgi:hypothetical protein
MNHSFKLTNGEWLLYCDGINYGSIRESRDGRFVVRVGDRQFSMPTFKMAWAEAAKTQARAAR